MNKVIHVVAGIVQNGKHILAARRKPGGPAGLKWEFAGGKVEAGEGPEEALRREMQEELSLTVQVGAELGTFTTLVGSNCIKLQCFWCTAEDTQMQLLAHDAIRWCLPHELSLLDWAAPDIPAVDAILRGIK